MSFDQIKVELCSHWGGDKDAAHAAWASTYNKDILNNKLPEDINRVVTGLVHLGHDTPKERLWLEFFMTVPIFIERQLDKTRMSIQYQNFHLDYEVGDFGRHGITQNELSGRYRTIPDRPYEIPTDVANIMDKAHMSGAGDRWQLRLNQQHQFYQLSLEGLKHARDTKLISPEEYKRAREVLRGELGTAYLTDMRIVMNMNAFEHIINQRLSADAQAESRVVAYRMIRALELHYVAPVMLEAMMEKNNWWPKMVDVMALLDPQTGILNALTEYSQKIGEYETP